MTYTHEALIDRESPDVKGLREASAGGTGLPYAFLLGLETSETRDLLQRVEDGLEFRQLEHFQRRIALPLQAVADLVRISPRTLSRRKEQGRLLPDESDRLLRIARVFGRAIDLFEGDVEAARHWLSSPQAALGGAVPLEWTRTDLGSREVENLIGRLEHGVFS